MFLARTTGIAVPGSRLQVQHTSWEVELQGITHGGDTCGLMQALYQRGHPFVDYHTNMHVSTVAACVALCVLLQVPCGGPCQCVHTTTPGRCSTAHQSTQP